jgi:hypothetical protein
MTPGPARVAGSRLVAAFHGHHPTMRLMMLPFEVTRLAVGLASEAARVGGSVTLRWASALAGVAAELLLAPQTSDSGEPVGSATMLHPTRSALEGAPLTDVHSRGAHAEQDSGADGEHREEERSVRPVRAADPPLRDAARGSRAPVPAQAAVAGNGHIDAEVSLVAESADDGASNGAGAHVHIAPPWERYTRMKAAEITERLTREADAVVSVVLLYESMNQARKTVIAAAERELARRTRSAPRPRA